MKEPTIEQKNRFYAVEYSFRDMRGNWQRMEEAFINEQFANAYYLTKLREYKIFKHNLDIGM